MSDITNTTAVVLGTSIVTFITGFMLGIYSIRGYLISPSLIEQRRHNLKDPIESDESDVDENDTLLDHAPNWANGEEADRRDGLRVDRKREAAEAKKKEEANKQRAEGRSRAVSLVDMGEECKLVLVTLSKGATKGPTSPEALTLRRWERHGQAKIAVQVKSQEELMALWEKARGLGITAEVIADAGRTQIEAGSLTVLGVGPAPKSMVDQVTGTLKLL